MDGLEGVDLRGVVEQDVQTVGAEGGGEGGEAGGGGGEEGEAVEEGAGGGGVGEQEGEDVLGFGEGGCYNVRGAGGWAELEAGELGGLVGG